MTWGRRITPVLARSTAVTRKVVRGAAREAQTVGATALSLGVTAAATEIAARKSGAPHASR